VRHIGIVVDSMPEMKEFYVETLGGEIVSDEHEDRDYINSLCGIWAAYAHVVKIKIGVGLIELLDFGSDEKAKRKTLSDKGLTHIAFTVENVESLYTKLKKSSISKPVVSGKHKLFFCRDVEGNLLELVEEL